MSCATCVGNVEEAVDSLTGVDEVSANFASDEGSVTYDPAEVSLSEIYEAIEGSGYDPVRETLTVEIGGMSCATCSKTNKEAIESVPGVIEATVNFASDEATVEYNPVDTEIDAIYDAIEDAGYEPVRPTEEEAEDDDEDEAADAYALYETYHPSFKPEEAETGEELLDSVRTIVRRYKHRWGIENGYKKLKKFRVRTTSKDHGYRFFNFAFACVLYNVWRLVDLLVKLAFEDEPDYSPRVQATTFLTLAGQHIGFDPPD